MDSKKKSALHKKRFGQYFSGKVVADMLYSMLPLGREWVSVVDPMAGIGDMLSAASKHSKGKVVGIEIDMPVATQCQERNPNAEIVCEDAFKSTTLITKEGWDLVITNPPYVRYQLLGSDDGVMPSAQEIRSSLLQQINAVTYLTHAEKELFLSVATNYSGLADMAVPAWILCALLVKENGYLAVVVPETWLNRDYAKPIQYLLNKCFSIEAIMHDAGNNWFSDAQVKTCLVVAKRQKLQPAAIMKGNQTKIIEAGKTYYTNTLSLFPGMLTGKDVRKWIFNDDACLISESADLPYEFAYLLEKSNTGQYSTLADLGILCGQGLRTGANNFFYATKIGADGEYDIVRTNSWDNGGCEYRVHRNIVIPALQSRSDVDGLVVSRDKLKARVFYFSGVASGEICSYINSAEAYVDAKGRRFKEYSAVKPNEKRSGDEIIKPWYVLPRFTQRHIPNLCLTRLSYREIECLYVEQSPDNPIAVDANLVTLWGNSEQNVRVALAVLNSTWAKLYIELICTTLGGGALKVEASHLRNLRFPKLSEENVSRLKKIGDQIVMNGKMTPNIQQEIDEVVFSSFHDHQLIDKAKTELVQKLRERSMRS